VRQQQFLNTYIFGAVCPAKEKVSAFISPYCNAEAMQIHLDILAEEVEKHAVLVLDRAGWHAAKSLKIPSNITLLHLPPYSPELNPKENFWQGLKNKYLANRVFDSFDDIMDSCENAWKEFTQNKQNFIQLCSRDWANIN
jgi:transposase